MIGFVTWPFFATKISYSLKGWPSDKANHSCVNNLLTVAAT